jgi:hypothetical protein
MLKHLAVVAFALSASMISTPSFAEKAQQPNTSTGDPNERICENIVLTGSRLATKRFCGTRAEWAERKRQDREALEQAQMGPCQMTHSVRGANGNGHQAC